MSDLTPPLKWHGGKQYLADRVIALMPPRQSKEHPDGYVHYIEPFFGGGAVLLANDPHGISEAANDLNTRLTNFWRTLQSEEAFGQFGRIANAIPFSEREYRDALAALPKHDSALATEERHPYVPGAVDFFVVCRQSLAGRMDHFAPLSRTRVRRGMNEQASAWLGAIEGLPAVHARLKRVAILGPRPAVEVIRQQDGPQTLFYLDPPYVKESRTSPDVYAHEMSEADHRELLESLARIKGRFLLSGYPSPMYDADAKRFGWKCHAFDLPNNSAGGPEKRRMTECVWTNY